MEVYYSYRSGRMETTTDILHKVRQIQADAQHLALNAESKPEKETATLIRDLAKVIEDLTQMINQRI